jgi:hypothetical protein
MFSFYGHYTQSGNCSVSDEEKGRCALTTGISHLRKSKTCIRGAHLVSQAMGEARYGGVSPF